MLFDPVVILSLFLLRSLSLSLSLCVSLYLKPSEPYSFPMLSSKTSRKRRHLEDNDDVDDFLNQLRPAPFLMQHLPSISISQSSPPSSPRDSSPIPNDRNDGPAPEISPASQDFLKGLSHLSVLGPQERCDDIDDFLDFPEASSNWLVLPLVPFLLLSLIWTSCLFVLLVTNLPLIPSLLRSLQSPSPSQTAASSRKMTPRRPAC